MSLEKVMIDNTIPKDSTLRDFLNLRLNFSDKSCRYFTQTPNLRSLDSFHLESQKIYQSTTLLEIQCKLKKFHIILFSHTFVRFTHVITLSFENNIADTRKQNGCLNKAIAGRNHFICKILLSFTKLYLF